MTKTFEVNLVLENVDFSDESMDRVFEVFTDAVLADVVDLITISSPIDAPDAETAAFRLIELVHEVLPEAIPVRLDQDLVSIPDIATRTGRTRESIRLLVEGKRGPGQFPSPIGVVGDAIRVWPWASVLDWFANVLGKPLDEHAVPPEIAAAVDAELAARRRAPASR